MLAAAEVGVAAPLSIMFSTNEKKQELQLTNLPRAVVYVKVLQVTLLLSAAAQISLPCCGGHVGCVLLLLHFSLSALLRAPSKIDFQEGVGKRHTANMLHTHTQTRSTSLFPNNKHLTIWKHRNLILLSNAFTGTTPQHKALGARRQRTAQFFTTSFTPLQLRYFPRFS